jgi:4-amino-4-deoxy-L-arabinose transferase-like glycosyltransferase
MTSIENANIDRRLFLLAVALAFLIFVFPLAVNFPLLDPDEGLHASIAQEMVERGDWVVPHFLGKAFLDKPILYFWCQALSLKCFGMNEFAVRLPGLFLGLLGCVTTGIVGGKMFGRTTGLISGIFYGTMILPVALAQAAVHDVALVPCVNLAILLFWQADRTKSWKSSTGYALTIGVILGIAILAKGLTGVAMVGVTYGSYLLITRQLTLAACYRGLVSLLIATAIASIWYIAVEMREPGYLHYYFIERHVLGFATATQSHGDAPWWLYLPVLLVGGLPWIGYLPITIRELFATSKPSQPSEPGGFSPRVEVASDLTIQTEGINPPARFSRNRSACLLWCWLIGCTILLSVAQSKLVTYLWPVFPAVAILAAIGWARLLVGTISPASKNSLRKSFLMSSLTGPLVLPIVVFVLQKVFEIRFGPQVWTAVVLAGLTTLVPLWFLFREKWQAMLISSTLTTAAQFLVVISLIVPIVAEQYTEKRLAEYFNRPPVRLPKKMYFVEQRIGSFIFYLDPALRASITKDQFEEIPRPRTSTRSKITFQAGDLIVLPEKRLRRAEKYLDLKNFNDRKVGIYLLKEKKE